MYCEINREVLITSGECEKRQIFKWKHIVEFLFQERPITWRAKNPLLWVLLSLGLTRFFEEKLLLYFFGTTSVIKIRIRKGSSNNCGRCSWSIDDRTRSLWDATLLRSFGAFDPKKKHARVDLHARFTASKFLDPPYLSFQSWWARVQILPKGRFRPLTAGSCQMRTF